MIRGRLDRYRDRVRRQLRTAFEEEHTPHEIGLSFAIGIFVTTLPTGGLGIGLFFVLVAWWSWISKPAIFASVAVLNPLVKPAVYVVSYQMGSVFIGTQPLRSDGTTITETAEVAARQFMIGNLLTAVLLSAVSYAFVRHLTRMNRQRNEQYAKRSFVSAILGSFRR